MYPRANDWEPPEEIREALRRKLKEKKDKGKVRYDKHRHDNTHYTNGNIVVIRSAYGYWRVYKFTMVVSLPL